MLLFNAGNMSADLAATFETSRCRYFQIWAYSAGGAGATRAGTLHIEESGDGTNWESLGTRAVTAAAELRYDAQVTTSCPQIRVRFVDSTGGAGAGELNATVFFPSQR